MRGRRSFGVIAAVVIVIALAAGWFALPYLLPEGGITISIDGNRAQAAAPAAASRPEADVVSPAPTVLGLAAVPPTSTRVPDARAPAAPRSPPPPQLSTERVESAAGQLAPGARLLIPVEGVRPEDLVDTYTQSRAGGRPHNAIDIPAPHGTPVLAAAEGRVLKLFQSVPGGVALYQLDPDQRTVYYYAHLDRYAPGIQEGQLLRRGELLGYVGDTGNAGPGNYHLHFGISLTDDPEQFWGGEDVNPYPLLRGDAP